MIDNSVRYIFTEELPQTIWAKVLGSAQIILWWGFPKFICFIAMSQGSSSLVSHMLTQILKFPCLLVFSLYIVVIHTISESV